MIVKDLIQLGFSEPEADLMDYIFLHPNCSVQDIVRDTNFGQPEVSIIAKRLGIYLIDIIEPHAGRGRPNYIYTLNMKFMLDSKYQMLKEYVHNYSEALQNLRNLETESN